MFSISKIFDREWYHRKKIVILRKFLPVSEIEQLELKHKINNVYYLTFGTKLHWHNPKTLNEKLIWLSWYWRNPLKTLCSDKYKVREYVTKTCGLPDTLLVPLYGVYNNADEIDFNSLPNEFVLKCNHGCAYNILVKDKTVLDVKCAKETLNNWLSECYNRGVAELHYDSIKPHLILCEKYLHNQGQSDVNDYKVYCVNGVPEWIVCCYDRDPVKQVAQLGTYDMNWNQLFWTKDETNVNIPKPSSLHKMIEYAKVLSKDFPLVRVDFYDVDGMPYLSELTFTPLGNMDTDYLPHINRMLGDKLKLPEKFKIVSVGGVNNYISGNYKKDELVDYKIFCFNGKPDYVQLCFDRDENLVAQHATFSFDWNQLFYTKNEQQYLCQRPHSLDKMIEYSRILSQAFPFVRCDFYEINGECFLGELTFTPFGNMLSFYKDEVLSSLGAKLKLPTKWTDK